MRVDHEYRTKIISKYFYFRKFYLKEEFGIQYDLDRSIEFLFINYV